MTSCRTRLPYNTKTVPSLEKLPIKLKSMLLLIIPSLLLVVLPVNKDRYPK